MAPVAPAPRITHPQAVPVLSTDAHLPAVHPAWLQPEGLKHRFPVAPGWQPEWPGDGRVMDRAAAAASVLVPLVIRDQGLQVLLTRRTDHLHDHAGQISFPGGRREPEDADAVDTALRETEEEVGLDRQHIEVLGTLPDYTTVTHFVVTPVVALVRPPFTLRPDPFEVAETFEVPMRFLMNPAHHRRHRVEIEGRQRHFLSMPWQPEGLEGPPGGYFIWGATAAMLRNLYALLSSPLATPESGP